MIKNLNDNGQMRIKRRLLSPPRLVQERDREDVKDEVDDRVQAHVQDEGVQRPALGRVGRQAHAPDS